MARRPSTCTRDRVHRRLGDCYHRRWGLGGAGQPTLGRHHRGGLWRDRVLYAVVRAAWYGALGNHRSRAHHRRLRHRVVALQSHRGSSRYGHRLSKKARLNTVRIVVSSRAFSPRHDHLTSAFLRPHDPAEVELDAIVAYLWSPRPPSFGYHGAKGGRSGDPVVPSGEGDGGIVGRKALLPKTRRTIFCRRGYISATS